MQLSDHERDWLTSKGAEMMIDLGVSPGHSAIDFGCGKGRYTIPLSQALGKHGTVTAIERNKDELDQLLAHTATFPAYATIIPFESTDLSLASILSDTIDTVLAFDVLQYVEDWPLFFNSIHRVLKRFGTLHIYPAAIPHPDAVDLRKLAKSLTTANFRLKTQSNFIMMHNKDLVTDTVYTYQPS